MPLTDTQISRYPTSGIEPTGSTLDHTKVYLRFDSAIPPTKHEEMDGGTHLRVCAAPATEQEFLCNPLAVSTVQGAQSRIQSRNEDFLKQVPSRRSLVDKLFSSRNKKRCESWKKYAEETERMIVKEISAFSTGKTGDSEVKFVILGNSHEERRQAQRLGTVRMDLVPDVTEQATRVCEVSTAPTSTHSQLSSDTLVRSA